MTATQQARIAGFNASLTQRGVSLLLVGTALAFDALVEDLGPSAEEFETGRNREMFSRVYILNTSSGLEHVQYNSVFSDAKLGKTHTVLGSEPHDILTSFRCRTESA